MVMERLAPIPVDPTSGHLDETLRALADAARRLEQYINDTPLEVVREFTTVGTVLAVQRRAVSATGKQLNLGKIVIKPRFGKFPEETVWVDVSRPDYEEIVSCAERNMGADVRIVKRTSYKGEADESGKRSGYSEVVTIAGAAEPATPSVPALVSPSPAPPTAAQPTPSPAVAEQAPTIAPSPSPAPPKTAGSVPAAASQPAPVQAAQGSEDMQALIRQLREVQGRLGPSQQEQLESMLLKSQQTLSVTTLRSILRVATGWANAAGATPAAPTAVPEVQAPLDVSPDVLPVEDEDLQAEFDRTIPPLPPEKPPAPASKGNAASKAHPINSRIEQAVRELAAQLGEAADGIAADDLDMFVMFATAGSPLPKTRVSDLTEADLAVVRQFVQEQLGQPTTAPVD